MLFRSEPEKPLRPGFGTAGRPITLRSNFFKLTLPKNLTIYDYTVDISPKGQDLNGPCKARIFELLESSPECAPHMGYIAHDRGARLVSAKPLPQPLRLTIRYHEQEEQQVPADAKVYTVEVKFIRELNTDTIIPYVHIVCSPL